MKKQSIIIGTLVLAVCVSLFLSLNYAHASALTPEESAVNDAVTLLENIYQSEVDDYNSQHPDSPEHLEFQQQGTVFYKPDGINAAILLNGPGLDKAYGYEVQITDSIRSGIDDPTIAIAPLTSAGFLPYYPYDYFYYPLARQYLNSDTGVLCAFSAPDFACGHISWYSITDDWKTLVNGIGSAYYAKKGVYPIVAANVSDNEAMPTIRDSEYASYQNVTIANTTHVMLFYRQSPTSEWVYFTDTQSPIDCSEFTGELQKGFAGDICYDGAQESRVPVPASSGESTPTAEEGTSVKTPDTGSFTTSEKGLIASIPAMIISALGITFYIARYFTKRHNSQVHFDKE